MTVSRQLQLGLLALLLAACGSGGTQQTPAGTVIGAQGGTLSSPDGSATLVIPAGALAADTTFTVTDAQGVPSGRYLLAAFDFQPDGTQFAIPAILTFSYDPAALTAGVTPNELVVAVLENGAWSPYPTTLDTSAQTISAEIAHFTSYGGGALGPGGPAPGLPVPGLYAAGGGGAHELHRVNEATGALTLVGAVGFQVWGMDFAPDGTLYASASAPDGTSTLITIDRATGAGTTVGPLQNAVGEPFTVGDVTFFGSTLKGWAMAPGEGPTAPLPPPPGSSVYRGRVRPGLVDIDTATGRITCLNVIGNDCWGFDPGISAELGFGLAAGPIPMVGPGPPLDPSMGRLVILFAPDPTDGFLWVLFPDAGFGGPYPIGEIGFPLAPVMDYVPNGFLRSMSFYEDVPYGACDVLDQSGSPPWPLIRTDLVSIAFPGTDTINVSKVGELPPGDWALAGRPRER